MASEFSSPQTAITIGNFDGVHRGHAALIRRARDRVGPGGRVIALAFDPHPLTRLRPEAAPTRLTTFDVRADLLRAVGADQIHRLAPDETLALSAREFLERVCNDHHPVAIVEGEDFCFGRGREGDVRTLADLGRILNFTAEIVPPVEVALGDHLLARASSSMLRWLIANGRVADAARMLGRPYALDGTVEPGDQRGRTIGFPTANIRPPTLKPADGVYACIATLPDHSRCPAAVNIGARPTFAGIEHRVEAHLLLPHGTSVPDYDWNLRIEFVAWIRDQVRFDGPNALIAQLQRDVRRVKSMVDLFSQTPPAAGPAEPGTITSL